MSAKKFFHFFSSEKGRTVALSITAVAGVSLFSAHFIPQTLLLNKYKEIIQSYQAGIERQVPDKVVRRFDKALEILEVLPGQRKLIKPFTVCYYNE